MLIETLYKSKIMLTDHWKGQVSSGDKLFVSRFGYLTTSETENVAGVVVRGPEQYPAGTADGAILGTFITFNSERCIENWKGILF